MTVMPPEIEIDGLVDRFTEVMGDVFEQFDEGVIFVLGTTGVALCARTPAAFKIVDGTIEVLVDVDILIHTDGFVCKVVAETSKGQQFVGPSGCGCGGNHPVPVDKGDVVTVKAGAFRCV